MASFGYVHRESPIHAMNPLVKIGWMLATVVIASLSTSPRLGLGLLVYLFVAGILVARLPAKHFVTVMLPFFPLAAGYFIMSVVFRASGPPVWGSGPLRVTAQGLELGTGLALRVLAILASSVLFTMTTDPKTLVLSFIQQARVNYRFGFGMYSALRFMPLARDEFEVLQSAHLIRGVGARQGLIGMTREYVTYAIPLLATMIRKAIRTAIAMHSKGFGALPTRTYLDRTTIKWEDLAWALALTGAELFLFIFTS